MSWKTVNKYHKLSTVAQIYGHEISDKYIYDHHKKCCWNYC